MLSGTDVDAQYERILSLVPRSELHVSCNGVLRGEYTSLNRAVNEITLAFARLKEIRDAVTKVQRDTQWTGCSTSLNEVMNSTMAMQWELQKEIEKVTSGDKELITRKRRRPAGPVQNKNASESNESGSSNSESSSEEESDSDSSESGSGMESQSEAECRMEKPGTEDEENNTGRSSDGTSEDSETSSDSESDSESDDKERGKALSLNPFAPEVREGSPIHKLGNIGVGNGNLATDLRLSQTYVRMIERLDRMAVLERNMHTPEVLYALQELLKEYGIWQLQPDDAVSIMKVVVKWAAHQTRQRSLVEAYWSYSTIMTTYTRQLPDGIQQIRLESLNAKLCRILRDIDQSNESATRSGMFTPRRTIERRISNNVPQLLMPPKVIATAANNQKRAEAGRANASRISAVVPENECRNGSSCAPSQEVGAVEGKESTQVDKGNVSVVATQQLHHSVKPSSLYRALVDSVNTMPVQNRVNSIPRVLLALTESMADDNGGQQKNQIIYSVGQVIDWITKGAGAKYHVDMYLHFVGILNAYAKKTPSSDQLQRTIDEFSRVVNKLEATTTQTDGAKETNKELNRDIFPGRTFRVLVEELADLSFEERRKRVQDVLLTFNRVITGENMSYQLSEVTKAMEEVQLWVLNDPREVHLFRLYGSLFKTLSGYVTLLRYRETDELERILARISRALSLPMAHEGTKLLTEPKNTATVSSREADPSGIHVHTEQIPGDHRAIPTDMGSTVSFKTKSQLSSHPESDSDSEDDEEDMGGSEAAWKAIMEAQQ